MFVVTAFMRLSMFVVTAFMRLSMFVVTAFMRLSSKHPINRVTTNFVMPRHYFAVSGVGWFGEQTMYPAQNSGSSPVRPSRS